MILPVLQRQEPLEHSLDGVVPRTLVKLLEESSSMPAGLSPALGLETLP